MSHPPGGCRAGRRPVGDSKAEHQARAGREADFAWLHPLTGHTSCINSSPKRSIERTSLHAAGTGPKPHQQERGKSRTGQLSGAGAWVTSKSDNEHTPASAVAHCSLLSSPQPHGAPYGRDQRAHNSPLSTGFWLACCHYPRRTSACLTRYQPTASASVRRLQASAHKASVRGQRRRPQTARPKPTRLTMPPAQDPPTNRSA